MPQQRPGEGDGQQGWLADWYLRLLKAHVASTNLSGSDTINLCTSQWFLCSCLLGIRAKWHNSPLQIVPPQLGQ